MCRLVCQPDFLVTPSGFSLYSLVFPRCIAPQTVPVLVDVSVCVFAFVHSVWAEDVGVCAVRVPSHPFPLSSCSLDAFLLGGEGRIAGPLASCPSQNRCLPRLSEQRDGWTLSDISGRPMRSQASVVAPMGGRGAGPTAGEPGGQGWPSSRRGVFGAHVARGGAGDSRQLRWRRRSPARASPGRRARAPPAAAQLPVAPARAPPARLMPPGAERAGGPVAAGR